MIPINKDSKRGCVVISSSCVSWQGGEIQCIEQCDGDTLQDTIIKLGNLLCLINDYLTPIKYNLSCFNFGNCPPDNFHDLLQFILDELCKLENITGISGEDTSLSSIIIPLPKCLQYVDDFGNTVTQLQLYNDNHNDYLTLIGNNICSLQNDIAVLENNITTINQQITAILNSLQNNDIILSSLSPTPLFSAYIGMSPPDQYQGVINQLMQYIQNISIAYNGNIYTPSLFMDTTPIMTIIDDMINNNSNLLCSFSPLTLANTYTIIDSISNLWEYIKDIRNVITAKVCNPCASCNDNYNIHFSAFFTDSETIHVIIRPPNGYIFTSINYSIYDFNLVVYFNGTTTNTIESFHNIVLKYLDKIYVHYSGCMINTSTQETCKYDYIITAYNNFIDCKHIDVSNISMTYSIV